MSLQSSPIYGHDWPEPSDPRPEGNPSIDLDREDDAYEKALAFNRGVAAEALRMRIREAARAQLALESADEAELPALTKLDAFLAVPDARVTHRIAGLWPSGGRVVLSAPHKAGKTTLGGNLLRSLVDGAPFLDTFDVAPVRRVLLLDNELDEDMLRRWLRDHDIRNQAAVELVALRGHLSTFNILDPAVRSRWAAHLGPADVLVFDCLRPALDALGLSEDKEAGRFLEALDELTAAAGIREMVVVHHMGHNGERGRGDSRILDWPDALWRLVKASEEDTDDDARPPVFFTAYGRDVEQPEALLAFDATTRRLSVAGGTRKDTSAAALLPEIIAFLEDHPGSSKNAIEKSVEGRAELIRKGLRVGIERAQIRVEKRGVAHCHWAISSTSSDLVPDEWTNPPLDLVPSSIDEGRGKGSDSTQGDLVPDEPHCEVCGHLLNHQLVDAGETTHPTCDRGAA